MIINEHYFSDVYDITYKMLQDVASIKNKDINR